MKLSDASWIVPLLQAVANGETLQAYSVETNKWVDSSGHASFNLDREYYRIKPKAPQYRLYKYVMNNTLYVCTRNTGAKFEDNHSRNVCLLVNSKEVVWVTDWLDLPEQN